MRESDNANYVAKKGNLMEKPTIDIPLTTLAFSMIASIIIWYFLYIMVIWLSS